MNLLGISCKDLSQIAAKESGLSLRERVITKAHLLICDHCVRYVKQLKILKNHLKNKFERDEVKDDDVIEVENSAIEQIRRTNPPKD